jgi:ubiquinol-cytochrome c reductase cytochrome c1 subunit
MARSVDLKSMAFKSCLAAFAMMIALAPTPASAGEGDKLPEQPWSFQGPMGTFDRAELQRGFQIYREVCSACHAMNLLSYRSLGEIGFSPAAVKAIAASVEVTAGPNEQGEMFQRPGLPSDRFKAPFPNDKAARSANNGALPPDLSLITKARFGGADYIYALLTGFDDPPPDFVMGEGMNFNHWFPGRQIAMSPPLAEGAVTYTDGTAATLPQMARDVAVFLTWAAEPTMEERKRIGFGVLAFLVITAGLLYLAKRIVWSRLH